MHACVQDAGVLTTQLISLWSYDRVLLFDKGFQSAGFCPSAPLPGGDVPLAVWGSSSPLPPIPKVRAWPWGLDISPKKGGTAWQKQQHTACSRDCLHAGYCSNSVERIAKGGEQLNHILVSQPLHQRFREVEIPPVGCSKERQDQ